MDALEFQVTLRSDVKSSSSNTPVNFTNHLARPLNLFGKWSVALLDLSYPHQWTNIVDDLQFAILLPEQISLNENYNTYEDNFEEIPVRNNNENLNIRSFNHSYEQSPFAEIVTMLHLKQHTRWVYYVFKISSGEYNDANDLIKNFDSILQKVIRSHLIRIEKNHAYYHSRRMRTNIRSTDTKMIVVSPKQSSILRLFGLKRNSKQIIIKTDCEVDVLYIPKDMTYIEAKDPIVLRSITNMFIYSDIVEDSLVGDTQQCLLGFLPVMTKQGDQGYWCFNPPTYQLVTCNKKIEDINVQLKRDNNEPIPITDGKVICRLNFKRMR